MSQKPNYKPALAYNWLTGLYDPVMRVTMREDEFKNRLVTQAKIQDVHKVLDLGCGTGTLTGLIKARHSSASVVGLDGDPKALQIARGKLNQAGHDCTLVQAMSYQMPFESASFDRVISSLLFHHLSTADKRRTIQEIRRVLKPGGELHIADWGKPHNFIMWAAFLLVRLLDGFDTTADNVRGLIPSLLEEKGFRDVREQDRLATIFGTVSLYSARNP